MTKKIDKLVKDIYSYLESYTAVTPEQSAELALVLSQVICEKLSSFRRPALSMSCIGHPQRKLKLEIENPIKPTGKQRLRFLYGDILEAVILWLAKLSGHTVESQQETVEVDKVKGHIDAIIDGDLVDVFDQTVYVLFHAHQLLLDIVFKILRSNLLSSSGVFIHQIICSRSSCILLEILDTNS